MSTYVVCLIVVHVGHVCMYGILCDDILVKAYDLEGVQCQCYFSLYSR